MSLNSLQKIITVCESRGISIAEYVIEDQMEQLECTREAIFSRISENLSVMKAAIEQGTEKEQVSSSGLTKGNAYKYNEYLKGNKLPGCSLFNNTITRALAVSEVNSCMGRIVAAPTAGACGIIPAVLYSLAEEYDKSEESLILALITISGVGAVIAHRATLSGAQGGCQAECGSASAMAAAGGVELLGGSPSAAGHACAMALKNTLGLVCDPVAGLVEVPCVKRNVMGAVNALSSINMALAGIESVIPVDEVIDAMADIGSQIHVSLRETAEGGLAATPTGIAIMESLSNNEKNRDI